MGGAHPGQTQHALGAHLSVPGAQWVFRQLHAGHTMGPYLAWNLAYMGFSSGTGPSPPLGFAGVGLIGRGALFTPAWHRACPYSSDFAHRGASANTGPGPQ